MSSNNGVLKIARRGIKKFQFGDDEPFAVDIIAVSDQWHEVNFSFRELKDGMWVLMPGKGEEFAVCRLNFVQSIVDEAYGDRPKPMLTRIEAEEFTLLVMKEAAELRNFSWLRSEETLSAPESTAEAVNFAQ